MTYTLPCDLRLPAVIAHRNFLGMRSSRRVDEIESGVTVDPRILWTLGLIEDRPLVRLRGDTVDAYGAPEGDVRGWQTFTYADELLEVLEPPTIKPKPKPRMYPAGKMYSAGAEAQRRKRRTTTEKG